MSLISTLLKQTSPQQKPAKNPKTHQLPNLIQWVSIMMLTCRAKNKVKRSINSRDI